MLSFQEYLSLNEQMPPAGGAAPPPPPAGGPAGGGLGAPPAGGLGGGLGGGMGGPPMGGAPGAGGPAPVPTKEVTPLDVWRVIERILEGKPANLKKPAGQEGGDAVDSSAQPPQPSQPPLTGAPPMAPPPGGMAGQAPPQHLLGVPGM